MITDLQREVEEAVLGERSKRKIDADEPARLCDRKAHDLELTGRHAIDDAGIAAELNALLNHTKLAEEMAVISGIIEHARRNRDISHAGPPAPQH